MKKRLLQATAALAALAVLLLAIRWPYDDPMPPSPAAASAPSAANIARGAYLARAGDCMACHTVRGGAAYAGGRALPTPFGTLYAPNITPDRATGIGSWSADDFWRALHNGKAPDGRLLYPAFPYTNYTKVTRADADALFAFLRSVPARNAPNRAHALRFPYDQQIVLAGWRALYFRPAVFEPQTARGAEWNRGAYLVEGLGHCSACHSSRNSFGAAEGPLSGGLIPMLGWYAPSLTSEAEAGLGSWDTREIAQLLKTGSTPRAAVFGPMAEVVAASLQHLDDADAHAMALYLKALPASPAPAPPELPAGAETQAVLAQGAKLYQTHCADCHGAGGKGSAPMYPALAGNRVVAMAEPVNTIRIVLNGGFAPATRGNPRPYGMPPFRHQLSDAELAALISFVRTSWGNQGALVYSDQVNRYRDVPLD